MADPWLPEAHLGFPWLPLASLGFPWLTLGFLGFPWLTLGSLGLPRSLGSPLAPLADPAPLAHLGRSYEKVAFSDIMGGLGGFTPTTHSELRDARTVKY